MEILNILLERSTFLLSKERCIGKGLPLEIVLRRGRSQIHLGAKPSVCLGGHKKQIVVPIRPVQFRDGISDLEAH